MEPPQLVAAKGPPKTDQHKCFVAKRLQWQPVCILSSNLLVQVRYDGRQLHQLEGSGPLFWGRVQFGNALEHLFYMGCFGRIGKTLLKVPGRQTREPLAQGV